MFIRAYLRASTEDQDASRARQSLETFAQDHGQTIAARYIETASGATADRPELKRLLDDASVGDVILVESVDRLSRLPQTAWETLKREIDAKGLRIVAVDLPTSHQAMAAGGAEDEFTARMLDAVNGMMIDVMAAVARKDYEQRRQRQQQGIEKAKAEGRMMGRPKDHQKRARIAELLNEGLSIRKAARHANASTYTVRQVRRGLQDNQEGDARGNVDEQRKGNAGPY